MSRERKEKERIARKLAYRAERGARTICTLPSEGDVEGYLRKLRKQLDAMPGKPEERYMVLLRCSDNGMYSYPIYFCSEGFTAALQDAIEKHQDAERAEVRSGFVLGIGNTAYQPPDYVVQAIALGAKVVVTNRLENRKGTCGGLHGSFVLGG